MKRLTQASNKLYVSSVSNQTLIDRLGLYEDMQEAIELEDKRIEADLAALRQQDKTKTARFREAFGRRLMHQSVLNWLKKFHLYEEDKS